MPKLFCRKHILIRKMISVVILLTFLVGQILTPSILHAQSLLTLGQTIGLTAGFQPPVLRGMTVHPENPLLFDFIVDRGQDKINNELLKDESTKLIKYFLTSMTIPDKDAWVNLSPTEKDRIIPDALGQTEMGRQMLEQDYVLKQLAASLTNPDTELGKKFWDEVKARSVTTGARSIVPLQNKVWIMPDGATVVEKDGFAYIMESKLTVMLDEDYVDGAAPATAEKNLTPPSPLFKKEGGSISTQVFREMILPKLIEEVNSGKNFAATRQVYQSVILAAWYKRALKDSLLGKIYADKSKIAGVETDVKDIKEKVYERYLEAFKKGAYNVIKEEDGPDGELIPRKYFSGGNIMRVDDLKISRSSSAINDARNEINTAGGQLALVAASGVENRDEERAVASSGAGNVISLINLPEVKEIRLGDTLIGSGLRDSVIIFKEAGTSQYPQNAYRLTFEKGIAIFEKGQMMSSTKFFSLADDIQSVNFNVADSNKSVLEYQGVVGGTFETNAILEVEMTQTNQYNYILKRTAVKGFNAPVLTVQFLGISFEYQNDYLTPKVREIIQQVNSFLQAKQFVEAYSLVDDSLRSLFRNNPDADLKIAKILDKIDELSAVRVDRPEDNVSDFQWTLSLGIFYSTEVNEIFKNAQQALANGEYQQTFGYLKKLKENVSNVPNVAEQVQTQVDRLYGWVRINKIKALDDLLEYRDIFDFISRGKGLFLTKSQWQILATVVQLRDQNVNISIERIAKLTKPKSESRVSDVNFEIASMAFAFGLAQLSDIYVGLKGLINDSAVLREIEKSAIKSFQVDKDSVVGKIRNGDFLTYQALLDYVKDVYLQGLPDEEIGKVLNANMLTLNVFRKLIAQNYGISRRIINSFVVNDVKVVMAGRKYAASEIRKRSMAALRASIETYLGAGENALSVYGQTDLPGIARLDLRHENLHVYLRYFEKEKVIVILGWLDTSDTKATGSGYRMSDDLTNYLRKFVNSKYENGEFQIKDKVNPKLFKGEPVKQVMEDGTFSASSTVDNVKVSSSGVMDDFNTVLLGDGYGIYQRQGEEGALYFIADKGSSGNTTTAMLEKTLRLLSLEGITSLKFNESGTIKKPFDFRMSLDQIGDDIKGFLKKGYESGKQNILTYISREFNIGLGIPSIYELFLGFNKSSDFERPNLEALRREPSLTLKNIKGAALSIKYMLLGFNRALPYIKFEVLPSGQMMSKSSLWGSLSLDEKLDVLIDLADTFQKMHESGIVYNNVSAQSILVGQKDGKPTAMPFDFTQSYLYGYQTRNGQSAQSAMRGDIIELARMINLEIKTQVPFYEVSLDPTIEELINMAIDIYYTQKNVPTDMAEFAEWLREIKEDRRVAENEYMQLQSRLSQQPGSSAASSTVDAVNQEPSVGGIDFDPSKLNLQIKRDGRGVPLPLPQQDLENININGLYPVILNILPVNAQTLPILGQLQTSPDVVLSKG